MNVEIYLTVVAIIATLAVLSFVLIPFYYAIYLSILERKAKQAMDFMKDVAEIQKNSEFDEAIGRIFEEGIN